MHRRLRTVGGNCHIVAGGAHVDARCVQVQLGQFRWQMLPLPCSLARPFRTPQLCCRHTPSSIASVDASPEGATDRSHSPERDHPDWGVTNDATVRLPDHALRRATSTSVLSVLVRTTRLVTRLHHASNHQLVSSAQPETGLNIALRILSGRKRERLQLNGTG